jgi:hypothetical protein
LTMLASPEERRAIKDSRGKCRSRVRAIVKRRVVSWSVCELAADQAAYTFDLLHLPMSRNFWDPIQT